MNTLPFTIEVDRSTGLISATAHQFWTLATLEHFEARLSVEQEAVRRSGLRPSFLIDVRQHGVQSKEVVQGLQRFASSANGRETKTAVVVESALYRLQAARIGSTPLHAIFRDEREARDWLLADEKSVRGEMSLSHS